MNIPIYKVDNNESHTKTFRLIVDRNDEWAIILDSDNIPDNLRDTVANCLVYKNRIDLIQLNIDPELYGPNQRIAFPGATKPMLKGCLKAYIIRKRLCAAFLKEHPKEDKEKDIGYLLWKNFRNRFKTFVVDKSILPNSKPIISLEQSPAFSEWCFILEKKMGIVGCLLCDSPLKKSVEQMLKKILSDSIVPDFGPVVINTNEWPITEQFFINANIRLDKPVISFCSSRSDNIVIPDSLPEKDINLVQQNGDKKPKFNVAGYVSQRENKILSDIYSKRPDLFEIVIARNIPEYFSKIPDLVLYWKYIIDIPDKAYSTRLKYYLFSKRPVLRIDRDCCDWYEKYLVAGVHYIPVKRDLSNLVDKVLWCKSHQKECEEIAKRAFEFANRHLRPRKIAEMIVRVFKKIAIHETPSKVDYLGENNSEKLYVSKDTSKKNIGENRKEEKVKEQKITNHSVTKRIEKKPEGKSEKKIEKGAGVKRLEKGAEHSIKTKRAAKVFQKPKRIVSPAQRLCSIGLCSTIKPLKRQVDKPRITEKKYHTVDEKKIYEFLTDNYSKLNPVFPQKVFPDSIQEISTKRFI